MSAVLNVLEVGPRYDCGIVSPTFGGLGLFLKPNSFNKAMQTQLRDEVIASATASIVDRDISLYRRVSQVDWSKGEGQLYFTDTARFRSSKGIDIHNPGQLQLVTLPEQIASAGAAVSGRGSAIAQRHFFFPWLAGQYIEWASAGAVLTPHNLPAASIVGDVETDATTIYFALLNNTGVWKTPAAVPANATQYDAGATGPYARLAYDPLKKLLYGITTQPTGAAVHKINAGGAPTVIYDFVNGRVDDIEFYQGNLIIAWNSAPLRTDASGSLATSRLYKYDGTNVTPFAEMPDGLAVEALKSYLGILFISCYSADPFVFGASYQNELYTVIGSVGPTRIGAIADLTTTSDPTSGAETGTGLLMVGIGAGLYISATGRFWRYDTIQGGLSRSFGDEPANANGIMAAAAFMTGDAFYVLYAGGLVPGTIVRITGGNFPLIPAFGFNATAMVGSRMDAGIPYVNKFWYALEATFRPLIAGESVAMEYSLDDGLTFTACSNSPYAVVGGTRFSFLVQKTNPHITYRVTLNAAVTAGSKGPIVTSVSARYIVMNAAASVYTMTVDCFDQIRSRGNKDEDAYAADALAFLDSIARQNELVTFYEPDDSIRTPHTCWVMKAERRAGDTSHVYNAKKNEAEVDVVLWETIG